MVGLPRKVKIGALMFSIGRAPAPDLGHMDSDNLRINVSPHQAPDAARVTLVHEITHAIATKTGLDKRWGDDEEFYVTLLSEEILTVLRANPTLVDYLMGDE